MCRYALLHVHIELNEHHHQFQRIERGERLRLSVDCIGHQRCAGHAFITHCIGIVNGIGAACAQRVQLQDWCIADIFVNQRYARHVKLRGVFNRIGQNNFVAGFRVGRARRPRDGDRRVLRLLNGDGRLLAHRLAVSRPGHDKRNWLAQLGLADVERHLDVPHTAALRNRLILEFIANDAICADGDVVHRVIRVVIRDFKGKEHLSAVRQFGWRGGDADAHLFRMRAWYKKRKAKKRNRQSKHAFQNRFHHSVNLTPLPFNPLTF